MEPIQPSKQAEVDVRLEEGDRKRFRRITLQVGKDMFEELRKLHPNRTSLTWDYVTRPMEKKAVDSVRTTLTGEGIGVTDEQIEERLKKVVKGQNDNRQKKGLKQHSEGQHHGKEQTPIETAVPSNSTASDAERPYDPIRDV